MASGRRHGRHGGVLGRIVAFVLVVAGVRLVSDRLLALRRSNARDNGDQDDAQASRARDPAGVLRTPHRRGRLNGTIAALLLVVGLLLLAEGLVTLAWQEPLSALSARRDQSELSERLSRIESAALASPTGFVERGSHDRTAPAVRRYKRRTGRGEPLGRIELPALGKEFVFVAGVSSRELKKGPGHYPTAALPGESGTVGIAGHRTTYSAPFRNLDRLERGDRILIRMPYGRFRYTVEGRIVVSPTNTRSLRRVRHDRLALTTCHPPFSAAKRLVVTARLSSSTLR